MVPVWWSLQIFFKIYKWDPKEIKRPLPKSSKDHHFCDFLVGDFNCDTLHCWKPATATSGTKKSCKLGDLGPKSVKHVGLSCQKFSKFFIGLNEVGMLWNVFVVLFAFLPDFNGSFCCNVFCSVGFGSVCQEIQLLRDWLFKLLELQQWCELRNKNGLDRS